MLIKHKNMLNKLQQLSYDNKNRILDLMDNLK